MRHFLVFALVALLLTTNLPRLLVRYLNQDYHITDIYYHVRDHSQVPVDEDIVLVNIGSLDRKGMTKQLFKLAQYKPKVIAMDVFFETERDSATDALLQYVLANTPNVVLICQAEEDSTGVPFLHRPYQPFAEVSNYGIAENLLEGRVGRKFQKKYTFPNGDTALHFATQIALLYDTAQTVAFLNRPNKQEYIYFKGNIGSYDAPEASKYTVLDVEDVETENFTPDLIEGKILLMGYLGSYAGDPYSAEDKFFSPLNKELSIRTLPDMFGVVFHANIISMILSGQYVERLSDKEEMLLLAGILIFNFSIFWFILAGEKRRKWYTVISSIIITAEILLYPYLAVNLFTDYRYLLELSYSVPITLLSSYIFKIYLYSPVQFFRNRAKKKQASL